MDVHGLVMVIENSRGYEYNYLLDEKTAIKKIIEFAATMDDEVCEFLMELQSPSTIADIQGNNNAIHWSTLYFKPNETISFAEAHTQGDLIGFLKGECNDKEDMWEFCKDLCSIWALDMLDVLKMTTAGDVLGYPECSYKPVNFQFKQGQELMNLNGSYYKVLQVLSPNNLLLVDKISGQFVVGLGTSLFERRFKQMPDALPVFGIEWERGVYLGNTPSYIDFSLIKMEYGTYSEPETLTEYRKKVSEDFLALQKIVMNPVYPDEVQEAAKESMYQHYMTGQIEAFYKNLDAGKYDEGFFQEKEEVIEEKDIRR